MALPISTSMFFLLLLPIFAIAQTSNGRVDVGKSLTAGNEASSWLSPSEEFAFGFHRPDDNKDLFLLAIWFDRIPAKTVVWWPTNQDGDPVRAQSGSKVTLTAENGLVLTDPRGAELWKSEIAKQEVAFGVMNNTGNFAIESGNSEQLWRSFDHPTDTLLPTQFMNVNGSLFSRQNNFSRGRFQLRLSESGNLELRRANLHANWVYHGSEPYYSINTTSDPSNTSTSGYRLNFNDSGDFFVLRTNGERFFIPGAAGKPSYPSSNIYQRVTLDVDGVLVRDYYSKQAGDGWSTFWLRPENICLQRSIGVGSGVCGFNSICSLNGNRRPICKCPPGFSFLDPSDSYRGCKRDSEMDCDEHLSVEDVYEIQELEGINFPLNEYELYGPQYTKEACRTDCLYDCMCAVAIYNTIQGKCWKKRLPVSNGRNDSDDKATRALIKVRKGEQDKKKQIININASIFFLGTSLFVNLALIAAFCYTLFFIYKKKPSKRIEEGQFETNLRFFTYEQLIEATNGFKEELGRGAFGIVYKGTLQMAASGSRTTIAVKKLSGMVRDGDKEFKTEINVIGKTHHKNLVRLLGFCEDREQRLLVYELLSNGTLADFLFGNIKPSWNQRIQIAWGIARGLLYLHEECSTQIIHCDIKPQNILLDDYYNARISDFGLSKLLMMDQTQTKTAIRGTKGYVAPEWFRNLPVTVKVDVYSFGVILLEIICCRRSVVIEEMDDGEYEILTYWAYDCYRGGKLEDLVGDDMEAMEDMENLEKYLMVAFWCIQEDPHLRPTMRKVTQMLEGVVRVSLPPNPSPFYHH